MIKAAMQLPAGRLFAARQLQALRSGSGHFVTAVQVSAGQPHFASVPKRMLCFDNSSPRRKLCSIIRTGVKYKFCAVSDARKSTGLGLSTAKTLTEKIGGEISAEYEGGILTIRVRFWRENRRRKMD